MGCGKMRPLNLKEFAQQLRLEGNEFADEILVLTTLEDDVAEPYLTLCGDLEHYAKGSGKKKHTQMLEWLGDRSNLLGDIEDDLERAGYDGDADDSIKGMIGTVEEIEDIMREHGGWVEGDLQDALFALIERADQAPKREYDL